MRDEDEIMELMQLNQMIKKGLATISFTNGGDTSYKQLVAQNVVQIGIDCQKA